MLPHNGFAFAHARRDMQTPYADWLTTHDLHGGVGATVLGSTFHGVVTRYDCLCGAASYREIQPA